MNKIILHTKLLTLTIILSLVSFKMFGQGSYFKLDVGYGLSMAGDYGLKKQIYTDDLEDFEYNKMSYGAGLNFGGTFGYMFNQNMGLEMGVSYLIGAKQSSEYIYSRFGQTTYNFEAIGKMLRLMPSIIITPDYKVLNPYVRFGMVIGMGSLLYGTIENDEGDEYVNKYNYSGGLSLGHVSSLGATYKTSEKAGIFFELNAVNMSFSPTKGELIESSENGRSDLHEYTTREKEIKYVTSYNSLDDKKSASEPSQSPRFSLPFGSINLNIGFKYNF